MDAVAQKKIEMFILKSMQAGTDPEDILEKLQKVGLSEETAYTLYRKMELSEFFSYSESNFKEKKEKLEKAKKKFGTENMIKIESIMNSPVASIEKGELLSRAIQEMDKQNIGAIVVTERKNPVGILTERDLLRKVLAKDVTVKELRVEDVMSSPLIYATTEDRLMDVENKMRINKLKRIPILKNGVLVGIITSTDIIRMLAII